MKTYSSGQTDMVYKKTDLDYFMIILLYLVLINILNTLVKYFLFVGSIDSL